MHDTGPTAGPTDDEKELQMQFSLIYRYDPAGPGPHEDDIPAWMQLSEDLEKAGAAVHETGYYPASEAVTVTAATDGTHTTTPGVPGDPISGYCTIQVDSLGEAIEWATKIPVAGKGTVEVRRVVEFDG